MNLRILLRSLALLGLALGQAEVFAGNFRLSPVQVFLGDGSGSALVTVYNESSAPVRFQITASDWAQDSNGEMRLVPTTDVLFFPKLLEVPSGGQRNVRVAVSTRPNEAELTYRIFFDELPPAPVPGEGAKVNVITKMGVPVFVTPKGARPDVTVEGTVSAGKILVDVKNRGTSHVSLQEVLVRGFDADGAEVFSGRREGWYVLGGSNRRYEIELSPEECEAAAEIAVVAAFTHPARRERAEVTTRTARAGGSCK